MFHVDPESKVGKAILILAVPLGATCIWFQLFAFYHAIRSSSWPSVRGIVVDSRARDVFTQHGRSKEAKTVYAYEINGRQYENDTVYFGVFRGIGASDADRKLDLFTQGRTINVFYNPRNPQVSCLEPGGIGWEDTFMFVLCVGGVVIGT